MLTNSLFKDSDISKSSMFTERIVHHMTFKVNLFTLGLIVIIIIAIIIMLGCHVIYSILVCLQRTLQSGGVGDDVRHVPDRGGCDRLHF